MPGPGLMDGLESAAGRLFVVLLKTFGAITLGHVVTRFKWVDPAKGEMKGIGFFVGKICFPLLFFRTVATAEIGNVAWDVVIACNVSKLLAYVIVFCTTFFLRGGQSRLLEAAIFAFFVIASNDFAVGFPVIDALYPVTGNSQDLSVYLAINALVVTVFFIPLTLILMTVGKSNQSGAKFDKRAVKTMISTIVLNPVIIMTVVGFFFQLLPGPHDELPPIIKDIVELATGPFTFLALTMTGASVTTLTVSRWPVLLVTMKVIFCGYVGVFLADLLLADDVKVMLPGAREVLTNFCFLYGSIPTSSAPLVFAGEFAPEITGLVANSIILGLLISGPTMFLSSIFFEQESAQAGDLQWALIEVAQIANFTSLACFAALLIILVMARKWFAKPPMDIVVALVLAAGLYSCSLFTITQTCGTMRRHMELSTSWILVPDPLIFFFCFLQNLCRLLTLLLLIWKSRDFPASGTKVAILGAVVLAALAALVTPPNTFNEMCGFTAEPGLIWRTTALVYAYFVVVVWAIVFWARKVRGEQLLPQPVEEVEREHPAAQGFYLSGLTAPHEPHKMPSTTSTLMISLLGRLFMEALIGTLIGVMGLAFCETQAFKQMLVLEHLLEHTQVPVLLAVFLSTEEFEPLIKRVFHSWSSIYGSSTDGKAAEWTFEAIHEELHKLAKPRSYMCTQYEPCVTGSEVVWLLLSAGASRRGEAAATAFDMMQHGYLTHVDYKTCFYDTDCAWFYVGMQENSLESSRWWRPRTSTLNGSGGRSLSTLDSSDQAGERSDQAGLRLRPTHSNET